MRRRRRKEESACNCGGDGRRGRESGHASRRNMVTGAVWANKLFMNTSTSELKSAIEFLNVTGLERSSSDYPYSGRTANGEWGMEHCCLLSKQIIEKIVPFPRPPAAAVVPSTKCPENRTSERRFLPPLLSSCPTHLTRSSPTMNDGVNCINFPLQKKRTRLRSALRVAFSPPLQFRLKSGNAKCRLCVQNPMKMFRAS